LRKQDGVQEGIRNKSNGRKLPFKSNKIRKTTGEIRSDDASQSSTTITAVNKYKFARAGIALLRNAF
jgi:hypothetical protein